MPTNALTGMDQIHNLLIVVAMEVEEKALLSHVQSKEVVISDILGVRAKQYSVGNHNIYILRSGVGEVNAAIGAATVVEKMKIDAIILLGVGGSLDPRLNIGDLVVSESVIQHDSLFSSPKGPKPMRPGQLYLSLPENKRPHFQMRADPRLVAWIQTIFHTNSSANQIYTGTILSGSEFVASVPRKEELAKMFPGALLVEMESAGIAQVADRAKIPFAVAKTVADVLREGGDIAADYNASLTPASEHSAILARELIKTFEKR